MRNAKTKQVLDYWLDLRGEAPVPQRSAVDPKDLRQVLPFVFLADVMSPDVTAFRLAGTGLCDRYGRELRNHNLQTMWTPSDRVAIRGLIVNVLKKPTPGLAGFTAETIDRRSISCEMLLLPLSDKGGTISKLLGCVFATESVTHLGNRPLVYQRLTETQLLSVTSEDIAAAQQARQAADPSEVIHHPAIRRKGHLRLVVSHDMPGMMPANAAQESLPPA